MLKKIVLWMLVALASIIVIAACAPVAMPATNGGSGGTPDPTEPPTSGGMGGTNNTQLPCLASETTKIGTQAVLFVRRSCNTPDRRIVTVDGIERTENTWHGITYHGHPLRIRYTKDKHWNHATQSYGDRYVLFFAFQKTSREAYDYLRTQEVTFAITEPPTPTDN